MTEEREPLTASPDQIEAVRRYIAAQQALRAASQVHTEAFLACREAGLEHYYDSRMGRARWPRERGEWRPENG